MIYLVYYNQKYIYGTFLQILHMNNTNQTLLVVLALIIAASLIATATVAIEPAEAKSAKKEGKSKSSDKGKGDGEVGTSAVCAVCTSGPHAYA